MCRKVQQIPWPCFTAASKASITRASDGGFAFVYIPTGAPITIDLDRLGGATIVAWWFDPRTGIGTQIRAAVGAKQDFVSPPFGPDWVLVVEDAAAGYGPPGLDSKRS